MTKRLITGAAAVATSLLLGVGSVGAADNAMGNHPDGKFLKEAAQGGMAEVALGQLAADKAGSDAVKNFGQQMVTDHGKANQELEDLAASEGVTLPTDMGAKEKTLQKKLSGLSGAEFDKAYMKEMLKDHQKDISSFKKEAEQGKDTEVKNWAAKTLPTLQEHYTAAQAANAQVTGKNSHTSNSHGAAGSAAHSSVKDDTDMTRSGGHVGSTGPGSGTK